MLVVDGIAKSLEGLDGKQIKRDTIYTLLTNGFLYIRNNVGKKNQFEFQQSIHQETLHRWMVIFGDLAKLEYILLS